MGPLVLMPLLLVAQTHSQWEASLRTEVRARTATPQDNGPAAAGDAELRPHLSGSVFNGPWTLSASYSPTFRTREPYVTQRAGRPLGDHSHVAQVEGVWAKEGSARLSVGEFFNYGTLDLSTLNREAAGVPGQPPPPLPIQPVRSGLGLIQELTTDTSAGIDWFLSQRLTLTTTAGFTYGGGADAASRRNLPLQSAYRAGAKLGWLATKRDVIGFNLTGQYIRFFQVPAYDVVPFNPGARIVIVELAGTYARLLAAETRMDLIVGITGSFGQLPNTTVPGTFRNVSGYGPLLAAGLSHREHFRAQQLDFRLNGQLGPFVDRFAGTVYQRVEGGGSLSWTNVHHVSAGLSAGVARSLPTGLEAALTTVYAEAAAGYQGDPWWRVDLVGRLSVVHQRGAAVPLPSAPEAQWVVGLSLTLIAASEQPRTISAQAE